MRGPTKKHFEEFRVALEKYKRVKRRPWPTWLEVLGVLESMGWVYKGKARDHEPRTQD